MKIALLEPQCRGLQHVPFNTSLLETLLLSLPDACFIFDAEQEHVTHVRQAIGENSSKQKIVWTSDFGEIVGDETITGLPRTLREGFRLARYCRDEQVDVLVLCSATSSLLAALELARPRSTAVIVFLHACVSELQFNPLSQFLRNPLSIHVVSKNPVPRGMRVVVLGASIIRNLRAMGLAKSGWESIDHPCCFIEDKLFVPAPSPVRFGYLSGFERNGADAKRMLDRVRAAAGCEIVWIGREHASSEILPPEEYRERLKSVHYAIWLGEPSAYRLKASGSFLDAITMGKPIVYLKDDFIDYYFDPQKPFGFPGSDIVEIEKILMRLAHDPPDDSYNRMAHAALGTGRRFSPEKIAPDLCSIILSARSEISISL